MNSLSSFVLNQRNEKKRGNNDMPHEFFGDFLVVSHLVLTQLAHESQVLHDVVLPVPREAQTPQPS